MARHSWPGNLRELQNRLSQAMLLARSLRLEPEDLGLLGAQLTSHPDRLSLEAYRAKADQEAISTSLSLTHQNISADARAQDAATDIASITADRGIVTRPGRFTIEPSFSHAHSNATRVAIEGYTVIPALLIGLINISEVQRDIFVGAVSLKYGFTSRFEAGFRVPYLSINEDLREREVFDGT